MSHRYVVLDTETTGMRVDDGNRIIEVGCVELRNRQASGASLHHYFNPEREVEAGAQAVHGMSWDDLRDKPKFADRVDELLAFVADSTVVIHNAPFDLGYLDMELKRVGKKPFRHHCHEVIDTLVLARKMFPGKRNSLDALCDRLGVANTHRVLHGALLDARLLADVYLAMTRGQNTLEMSLDNEEELRAEAHSAQPISLPTLRATDAEIAQHQAVLDAIDKESKGQCVWKKLGEEPVQPN